MRVFSILLALVIFSGCDDSNSSVNTSADGAPDMMRALDGALSDSSVMVDGSVPDTTVIPDAMSDAGAPDAMVEDAAVIDSEVAPDSGMAEISPVDPCGDDLQVVCGTVIPNLGMVQEVDGEGLDPSGVGPYAVTPTVTEINGPRGDEILSLIHI